MLDSFSFCLPRSAQDPGLQIGLMTTTEGKEKESFSAKDQIEWPAPLRKPWGCNQHRTRKTLVSIHLPSWLIHPRAIMTPSRVIHANHSSVRALELSAALDSEAQLLAALCTSITLPMSLAQFLILPVGYPTLLITSSSAPCLSLCSSHNLWRRTHFSQPCSTSRIQYSSPNPSSN